MKMTMFIFLIFSLSSYGTSGDYKKRLDQYKKNWMEKDCPKSLTNDAKSSWEVDIICKKHVAKKNAAVNADMSKCPCEETKRDRDVQANKTGNYRCTEESDARYYYYHLRKLNLAQKLCPSLFKEGHLCFLYSEDQCLDSLLLRYTLSAAICQEEYVSAESELKAFFRKSLREDSDSLKMSAAANKIVAKYKKQCRNNKFLDKQRIELQSPSIGPNEKEAPIKNKRK